MTPKTLKGIYKVIQFQRFTERMDGITTDVDRQNKYNAYLQCVGCTKWTFIIGNREHYGKMSSLFKCEHCGSKNCDSRSVLSKRTFNPATHNKRKIGFRDK